uniref:Transposase n=1 Tax=Heterorhabditis bacteriophora TaxID=37862 RepID=A0A1I7XHM4_HETBA
MSWVSRPSMNPNNRIDVFTREQSRRAERLLRTVAAHMFAVHL